MHVRVHRVSPELGLGESMNCDLAAFCLQPLEE
jgi:hypothetical protein